MMLMSPAYLLLALALVLAWLPAQAPSEGRRPLRHLAWHHLWLVPAVLALGLAFVEQRVQGAAWLGCLVLLGLGLMRPWLSAPRLRALHTALGLLLALALAMHLLPGNTPLLLVDRVTVGESLAPFSLRLQFDKAFAGLLLLACWVRPQAPWGAQPEAGRRALLVAAATLCAVLGLAWAVGMVRPDLKWPSWAPSFLLANLLFTCIMEEAFFRGVLQASLARALTLRLKDRMALAQLTAVLIMALLFGLVHLGAGWPMVVLATLAGLGYGGVYALTGRLEAAVLLHFGLNALHFLVFSYPYFRGPGPM